MTTNQKWILGIAVALLIAYFLFKAKIDSILESFNSAKRTIEDKISETMNKPIEQQTIIIPGTPINPTPPRPATCDQVKNQMDMVKAKLAQVTNPQQHAAIEKYLLALNQQYIKMGCVGPGPVDPNTTI